MKTLVHLSGLVQNSKLFLAKKINRSTGLLAVLAIAALTFAGCEENMWLKSEKKLRNNLEGTWTRLWVTKVVTVNESWTFRDGVIVIVSTELTTNSLDDGYIDLNTSDNKDTVTYDVGNYSVDAKVDNAYLRLSNLEENIIEAAKQGLSAKWTIVDIDGSLLYIAAENSSAIIQREFEKK